MKCHFIFCQIKRKKKSDFNLIWNNRLIDIRKKYNPISNNEMAVFQISSKLLFLLNIKEMNRSGYYRHKVSPIRVFVDYTPSPPDQSLLLSKVILAPFPILARSKSILCILLLANHSSMHTWATRQFGVLISWEEVAISWRWRNEHMCKSRCQ